MLLRVQRSNRPRVLSPQCLVRSIMFLPKIVVKKHNSVGADSNQLTDGTSTSRYEGVQQFIETDPATTMNGKKVRFAQPLEICKEFDKDTSLLRKKESQTNEDHNEKTQKTKRNVKGARNDYEKRRGKIRAARTITEAVEKIHLQDEKTSVRKFIAHYKRSTARENSTQSTMLAQREVMSSVVRGDDSRPLDVITATDNHKTDSLISNIPVCRVCNICQNHSSYLDQQNGRVTQPIARHINNTTKQRARPSRLPTLCNGKKLFEERLLPHSHDTLGDSYGCHRLNLRGISLAQYPQTPMIVQLFD